ncbi:MAG: adenylate kinase [candidate division Zixibacteria bacterium RBG_16_50_21]|nr:MAG: adenylate kinase [candidate division Zixibacteria bacterium RBG_16_50_21]
MFLILLGPPGSGKGTQARYLESQLKSRHLSSGDILRAAVKNNTELGKKAKSYMDKGELVPDDLMIDFIKTEMADSKSSQGYLLDGFPRNLVQAEKLEQMLAQNGKRIDLVIKFSLPEEMLIKRLTGRLVCPRCNSNFNLFLNPPQREGICDKCGGRLEKRKDDQEEVVRHRIKVYRKQTEPLEEYYRGKKKLAEVNASLSPEEVSQSIQALVRQKASG